MTTAVDVLKGIEQHADAMLASAKRASGHAVEIARLKSAMSYRERVARRDATGKNAQERDDNVAEALDADELHRSYQNGISEHRRAQDEADTQIEYHKIMARALTAYINQGGA